MTISIDVKRIVGTLLCCILCLMNAFSAEPDSEAYRNGVNEYNSWHYGEALDYFVEADVLEPNNGYIYYYIGNIMYLANNYQSAYDLTMKSLEYFMPEDAKAQSDAYLFLAFLANGSSDEIVGLSSEDTAAFYDAAVRLAPTYWKAYLDRGNWYNIYREEYTRSDADYVKSIELNPKEVEPYSRLIWSYQERGMLEEAEKICRMCLKADLEYPYHHDVLVELLLKKGDREEARDILWKAFMKSNGYYFQGMSAVYKFPEEDQQWFINQIRRQAEAHPEQTYWREYLE